MMDLSGLLLEHYGARSIGVIGIAFVGGIISSLLPCAVGMLPVIIGYITGYGEDSKFKLFLQLAMFILGIAIIMTILGVAASVLGLTFGNVLGSGWYYTIGALAILMGLQLLEVIHLPLPQFVTKLPETNYGRYLTPLVLGMAFGTASSPCGTPFLLAILGFISHENDILLGGTSLFSYALGQGVLLMIVGLGTGMLKHMGTFRKVGSTLNKVSAVAFLLVGAMFIAQGLGVWNQFLQMLGLI